MTTTTTLELPVKRVVVMEDRAQVERAGEVALAGGRGRFEVPGVALVAVDRSLKVEVTGGALVDTKLVRRWKEKPKGGLPVDATALRKKAKALEDELRAWDDTVARLAARREVLLAAQADLVRAIQEQAGFGTGDASAWKQQLDAVAAQNTKVEEDIRVARRDQQHVQLRLSEAQVALGSAEERIQDLEGALALTIEGSGQAAVRVSYLVPCAVWRPAYRATLKDGAVLMEAEAVVWQRTGEAWKDVKLSFSTARPTLGTAPPALVEDCLSLREKLKEEKKVVHVAIREEVIQTSGEAGGEPELPGLDDGGEARLLEAPGAMSVPSDGQPHRIPLARFEAKAELERVCPAEHCQAVSLVARFPNDGGQVLLAGPVDLVRQSGFVGRSQLKFAAPGELLKLSFGSEDGLRVVRVTDEETDESRLTGRRTTKKTVAHFVSNASPVAAKIVIEERVPVSEVKEVEVQVLTKECSPAPAAVSKEGIARIELELAPNGTKKTKFQWELQAAGKVAGV